MIEWKTCEHCYTDFPSDMMLVYQYLSREANGFIYLCDDCAGSLEQDAPFRRIQ